MVKDNTFGIAPLQDKMLELLKELHGFCEGHHLQYFLAGGTCLGAIRHDGFIPWDDDLDVYMPRDDYEKLWNLLGNEERIKGKYRLCRTSLEKNYHHRVMQLVDLETTFIHTRSINDDVEHGVYIDIIPLDACPNNRISQIIQFFHAIMFSVFNIQCKPEYNGGKLTPIMNLGTTILLGLIRNQKTRWRIWKRAEKKMTRWNWAKCENVKCITSKFHELCTAFPKSWFQPRKSSFEDMKAFIPLQAEKYCEAMYGDFMSIPPKEDQTVRHNTILIDLDNPYTKYRGEYYCRKE